MDMNLGDVVGFGIALFILLKSGLGDWKLDEDEDEDEDKKDNF